MKIAFFTEGQYQGKVPRNYPNMRTEMAWMNTLDADHYNLHQELPKYVDRYDLGIIIIPKKNPKFDLESIKKWCNKVASMQEGPHWYFQDYKIEQQVWFYNMLMDMDFLFVHNELDRKYFSGLTGKECIIMPSLMIGSSVQNLPKVNRQGVMIGGNFCSWYGGFDSYIVAQEFGEHMSIPSMGRRIKGEEQMDNLTHLPYMEWVEWIRVLNNHKYGVHLMRTHAAGTFALNCAYLGIPCIGYKGLDTQMVCHPDCTVEVADIPAAKEIAKKLRKDEKFYLYCSNKAKENYLKYYHENQFNTTFKKQFKIS